MAPTTSAMTAKTLPSDETSYGLIQQCFLCMKSCKFTCFDCDLPYCSEDHFIHHRIDTESTSCLPYRVVETADRGRSLVATRDIKIHELILTEEPVSAGPALAVGFGDRKVPVCVECFVELPSFKRCPKCNFPLCQVCLSRRGLTFWHYGLDCPQLVKIGFQASDDSLNVLIKQISCLLVFRLLLKHGSNFDIAEGIAFCESSVLQAEDQQVKRMLLKDFQCRHDTSVMKALKILRCNAKSLDCAGNGNGSALYSTFSLINHSCLSNAAAAVGAAALRRSKKSSENRVFHSFFSVEVRATRNIEQNEEITIKYLPFTTEEPRKSRLLVERWEFTCSCLICRDESDMWGHSAIKCSECNDGAYLIRSPSDVTSKGGVMNWKCQKCAWTMGEGDLLKLCDKWIKLIDTTARTRSSLEAHISTKPLDPGGEKEEDVVQRLQRMEENVDQESCTSQPFHLHSVVRDLEHILHPRHTLLAKARLRLLLALNDLEPATLRDCEEALDLSSILMEHITSVDAGATRSAGIVWGIRAAFLRRKANAVCRARGSRSLLLEGAALSHGAALEAEKCMRHDCILTTAQARLSLTSAHSKRKKQALKDVREMKNIGDKLNDLRLDCPEILLAQIAKEEELILYSNK